MIDKRKAIISDGLYSADSLTCERYSFNAMIEFVTIRKLRGELRENLQEVEL